MNFQVSEKFFSLLAILITTFFVYNTFAQFQTPPPKKCVQGQTINTLVKIVYANDGDTVAIETLQGDIYKVRLVGTDSPESYYQGRNQGPWATRAKEALNSMIPAGTQVRMGFDPQDSCDRNGRFLAHIFLLNGLHVNRAMVEQGFSVNYCVAPSLIYCEEFGQLTNQAMQQKRGFFQDSSVLIPYEWRQIVGNSTFVYYVGDMKTKLVYSSNNMAEVPVGNRVIFYNPRYISLPFRLAEGQIPPGSWQPPQRD